jgi:hypothetical protein
MSFIRTADEPRIPLRGVFWILMYLLAGGLCVRYCAPFPPQHAAPVYK